MVLMEPWMSDINSYKLYIAIQRDGQAYRWGRKNKMCKHNFNGKIWEAIILIKTTSVIKLSEFLATDPEV
jgi:hypothetical protein